MRNLLLLALSLTAIPPPAGAQIRPIPLESELPQIRALAGDSHPIALYQLATCYSEGIGVEIDFVEALSLAQRAAELSDVPAMVMVSQLYQGARGITGDRLQSYKWAKRAADTGDTSGIVALAHCYRFGWGVPKDENEMMRLLRRAAESGNSYAIASLSRAYLFGDISLQNIPEGLRLAKRADELNQRLGTVCLAYASYLGRGVAKDEERGRSFALKASKMGSAEADTLLGGQILANESLDPASAIPYLNRGLKMEVPRAMWALGTAYAGGRGVPRSYTQALELWRRGAERGDEFAMHDYANATYNGIGRLPDQALGFGLYLTAASLGNETTQAVIQRWDNNFKRSTDFIKGSLIAQSIKGQLERGMIPVELGADFHSSQFTVSAKRSESGPKSATRTTGTGLVFSTAGHCFTNHHVIDGASEIKVYLPYARKTLSARVVASDEANDLAILKIDSWNPGSAAPATPPPLSSASKVRIGDKAFTIGFPLSGFLESQEHKYASGDISATSGIGEDRRLFQITTPIQPGNSGGPLSLPDGRIVGVIVSTVNSAAVIRDANTIPQNINFAVKIDYLRLLASSSGIDVPENLPAGPDPIEHVKAYTVQVIAE